MKRLSAFGRQQRGATVVEFALIATPLVLLILGLVDLGFRQYMAVMLQGSMDAAARQVTVGGVSQSTVTTFVTTQMQRVLPGASVTITPKSYYDFSAVGKPEPITTDTPPLGVYNTGDCFEDLNGNGRWDSDAGTSGTGGSDDIVYYTAVVSYPAIVPIFQFLGWSSTESVQATMMMRNQPYASQPTPAIICT